jgi:lipopolysaccharide/colanic/teichoic acid biosynthesis glycosyltransferase
MSVYELGVAMNHQRWAELKRGVDIVGAAILLVVLAPFFGIIALAAWVFLGRPIFSYQVRPGRDGLPFRLVKFRTMRPGPVGAAAVQSDGTRLTRFGRFLRTTSLDELPELWNVARGDMSLVGPRPLLMEYLPLYTPEQARRHEVRPGITGWAQVGGRNAISWEERFRMDAWYVDHCSLWLDARILVGTAIQVFLRRGVSQPGRATMEPFRGSDNAVS